MKQVSEKMPPQLKGGKSDITHRVRAADDDEGLRLYERARHNLLNINNWEKIAGKLSASFQLTDASGKDLDRFALQGDFIKIHLPTAAADKFEWVRIETIEEQKSHVHFNWIIMRVRPTDPPTDQMETEHFFSKDATSSFSVERTGRTVKAAVRGRNELPNTEKDGLMDKVRNAVIAIAAIAGMNKPQWKGLVKGIISK